MKSTLKFQARILHKPRMNFNQRFHVTIEDKFKTHEMSINFSHPKFYQPKDD